MKKIKLKELFLLILIALMFFIIGNMFQQNIYANLKDLILSSRTYKTDYTGSNVSLIDNNSESDRDANFSLNKIQLENSNEPLKILVAGHIYGNLYEVDNYHPAMTIETNIQLFNRMNLDMIVLLGDIVREPTEKNFIYLRQYFLNYLDVPVFNAVGNHDIQNRLLYTKAFGETNFSFIYKDYLFLILDTNIESLSLSDDQIKFIKEEITHYKEIKNTKGVLIFAHHVFFFKAPLMSTTYKYQPNMNYSIEKNVEVLIEDYLIPISMSSPIYIFTGDVGARCGNLSPYYEKYENSNVTAFATGIGNCEEDSVLLIQEINDELLIEPISLIGKKMQSIESYDSNYWKEK